MSLTYRQCNPAEIILFATYLTQAHWDEAGFNLGFELDLDDTVYDAAHECGIMHAVIAMDGDRIVGYAVYYVCPHNFNPNFTVAASEALYVHPDYRGGLCAPRLIRFSESHAKSLGAVLFTWHCRAGTKLDAMLLRRGYEQNDIVMSRRL
jgi:GNAT superfamily N-acetyltransferase